MDSSFFDIPSANGKATLGYSELSGVIQLYNIFLKFLLVMISCFFFISYWLSDTSCFY